MSSSEPALTTDPALADILLELSALEPIFHRPEPGSSRADFERLTAPDFWEVGASGRRYSRAFVLDVLDQRRLRPESEVFETSDFYCRRLAPNVFLLTYTLLQQNRRLTRRSTIWQRTSSSWQILFHQGTIVQE